MRFPFVGNIRRVMADKLKSHGAVGYREKDDIVDSDRLAGRSLPFSKIIITKSVHAWKIITGVRIIEHSREIYRQKWPNLCNA